MCHPGWKHARIEAQCLSDLARLRGARDRTDREDARPPDAQDPRLLPDSPPRTP